MKGRKVFLFVVLFAIIFVYMTNIDKIPNEIVLFQNENYEINYLKGIKIDGNIVSAKDSFFQKLAKISSELVGSEKLTLSAFGGAMKKDINVSVLPATSVVVGGETVGIRLYSRGVLVIRRISSSRTRWELLHTIFSK